MAFAKLARKGWCRRKLVISCGVRLFSVEYTPWGLGTEYVYVDGVKAIRRQNGDKMSHGYSFKLDEDHTAELVVALPEWGELLPLCDLSFVQLKVDGETLYEEGAPPARQILWTQSTKTPARAKQVPRHAFDW